jgi:uncharacterized protein involved in exopolysaccharide biosynthesis
MDSGASSSAELAPHAVEIPLTRIAVAVIVRKRILLRAAVAGLCIGLLLAFLSPSLYSSSASLMPPESSTVSSPSVLSELNGPTLSLGGANLTSQRTPASTIIGIMKSRTEQDALINRFDLRQIYNVSTYKSARDHLTDRTVFDEDKKSGIVTITVTDRDPKRAQQMAQVHIDILNSLLSEVNTSAAGRERAFLESRLQGLKQQIDESSTELSKFSIQNGTLNPASQGEALIGSESRLQSQLDMTKADLSGLRATYSDDNTLVKAARARIVALEAELHRMGYAGSTSSTDSEPVPSMRQLPIVTVKYTQLYRRVAMQQAVYETLTKQYELARVQEAKELPLAKELDKPVAAERRTSPQRTLIVVGCTVGASLLAIIYVAITAASSQFEKKYRIGALLKSLAQPHESPARS